MRRPTCIAGVSILAAIVGAVPARAATVCVAKTGASCHNSIQAAVDAASAGDTVLVHPGVYNENVMVWNGKDGLQIAGVSKSTTILNPDYPLEGWGIEIMADSVQVRNLTIRNGQDYGIFVLADDALIQGVRIFGLEGSSAIQVATGTSGHRILANEIRGVAGYGIRFDGTVTHSLVQGNLITQAASSGISASGDGNQILANKLLGIGNDGILASGNGLVVSGNVVERAGGAYGLYVAGHDPKVRSNTLINAGQLSVSCTSCTAGMVAANTDLGSATTGIYASADGPGLVLQGNKVGGAFDRGFTLAGQRVEASLNTATDTGAGATGHCFDVSGTELTLSRNTATRCGASGFRISGIVTLDQNTATGAGVSGFVVSSGTANVLTHNQAAGNAGQGFAVVGGTGAVLTGNTALKHRKDFCNEGTGTNTSGGNTFGSTAATCAIVD